MAKNLFEQLLSKAGEIWSGPKTHQHPIYKDEAPAAASSVAKYLAKQEQAAKPTAPEQSAAQLTGVARYLARQQPPAAASQPAQGVVKTEPAPTTGVGKYLARMAGGTVTSAKAPETPPKTGVGKYLAGMPITRPAPAESKPVEKKPEEKSVQNKTVTTGSTDEPATLKPKSNAPKASALSEVKDNAEKIEAKTKEGDDGIHSDEITQCQAQTGKGTRCKNTSNLTKVSRTIDKHKYQFMVCAHHRTDTFKPHPSFLVNA